MKKRYAIGIDFGSLSARAALFQIEDGKQIGENVSEYKHGVIEHYLCGDKKNPLEPGSLIQHPQDFLDSFKESVQGLLMQTKVEPEEIAGIGMDATSCTLIPADENGTPLCFGVAFKDNQYTYFQMWKQHTTQAEADEINELAHKMGESFVKQYSGKISCEWAFPKMLHTLRKSPEVYEAADTFYDLVDWLVLQITGEKMLNCCSAGGAFCWNDKTGFPSSEFLSRLDERFGNAATEKLSSNLKPIDHIAGYINEKGAELTGLKAGTPVAVGKIDSLAAVCSVGVNSPGKLVFIMGTGAALMVLNKEPIYMRGLYGVYYGGAAPDYYVHTAGITGYGDTFDWFIENALPINDSIKTKGELHMEISEKAEILKPGESGLVAINWWNGDRSPLNDFDLSGVLFGYTLQTKPEEVYRALLEATAYNVLQLIDNFKENGMQVDEVYAVGGIPKKNKLLVQIYADILGIPIIVPDVDNACTLGSGIYAAVAAGKSNGGYDSVEAAIDAMACKDAIVYSPDTENHAAYIPLYEIYKKLHFLLGEENKGILHQLKRIRTEKSAKRD